MTSNLEAITDIEIPGFSPPVRGKVRNIFECNGALLFVATDRISAFDVILQDPIPNKGKVLTSFSQFWFGKTSPIVKNHFITSDYDEIISHVASSGSDAIQEKQLELQRQQLEGRSMLVEKCTPLPVECVVRGYLSGSGWKEYKHNCVVGGHHLPEGLVESCELPTPIFTPATKAQTGHDENIDFAQTVLVIGESLAQRVRDISLKLYQFACDLASERGIIIADTKFEFGIPSGINLREAVNQNKAVPLILIDEALTPDSSRFWPADLYEPGKPQPSFDKQFVRDYLETLDWDKQPPAPKLPEEIVRKTMEKYLEALDRITK